MNKTLIITTLARIIVLMTAIPVHELAHAWVAYKLGDPTAKRAGRITLNPFKHFDLLGSLALVFVGIGWAKPVPVDMRYFRNPRAGMALTAAAGPLSNVAMSFVAMILYKTTYYMYYASPNAFLGFLNLVFYYMAAINAMLAIFNMLPFPPFDGSRIFGFFLPQKWYYALMGVERFIYIAVLLLVVSGVLNTPVSWLQNGLLNIMDWLTGFVDLIAKAASSTANI